MIRPSSAAPQNPEAGPELDHGDRNGLGGGERIDAAIGLHDVDGRAIAVGLKTALEPLEIALGERLDICRENGRVGALVFAPLASDLVRGDHGDVRPEPARFGHDRLLVRGVGVGVQQANGDGAHAFRAKRIENGRQIREVEGRRFLAAIVDAPGNFAA